MNEVTHCPTCGAASDVSANGWQHRAQAAEEELAATKRELEDLKVELSKYHTAMKHRNEGDDESPPP
jgi:hypothetical protein